MKNIRVLVVDDSALVQKVLQRELSLCPGIEVVATASDPIAARDRILEHAPDVITLDIEMPRMDGLTFLEKLMKHRPTPVVIVSSVTPANGETALRALALGAVEVLPKPGTQFSVPEIKGQLATAIRAAAVAQIQRLTPTAAREKRTAALVPFATTDHVVVVGASTGGVRAVETLVSSLDANTPGFIVVQHMPTGFTTSFAKRLDGVCAMTVREAEDGMPVTPGVVLIAPAGRHTLLARSGGHYVTRVKDGPAVQFQRPSVDVLFQSAAEAGGANVTGILLTGMGQDGARGLLALREAGAYTIAEDASTCVVFGMPRAAIEMGAACAVLPLNQIASRTVSILRRGAGSARVRGQLHAVQKNVSGSDPDG